MTLTSLISSLKDRFAEFKTTLPSSLAVEYRAIYYDDEFEPVERDSKKAAQYYAEFSVCDAWVNDETVPDEDKYYTVASILVDIKNEEVTDETLDGQLEEFKADLDRFTEEVTYCPSVLDFLKEKIAEEKRETEEFEMDINRDLRKIKIFAAVAVAAVALISILVTVLLK